MPDNFDLEGMLNRILCLFVFALSSLSANLEKIIPSPISVVNNSSRCPSLVNSVDFHPTLNRFCVTYTHNHRIDIYEIDEFGRAALFQQLLNPGAQLINPQHALYSKNGQYLIVANWSNQTFNIYRVLSNGLFHTRPAEVIDYPSALKGFKPHGMSLSSDGNYLAIAFGASKEHPKGVGLFRVHMIEGSQPRFDLVVLHQDALLDEGIPKGISFTPDDSHLMITLAETNSVVFYSFNKAEEEIEPVAKTILRGRATRIHRPEDIKLTADGAHCCVSNSMDDTVTFYAYDLENHLFPSETPSFIIQNPEAKLSFPHGLAFSSDGQYLAVTQFGPVTFSPEGHLQRWAQARKDCVSIFQICERKN